MENINNVGCLNCSLCLETETNEFYCTDLRCYLPKKNITQAYCFGRNFKPIEDKKIIKKDEGIEVDTKSDYIKYIEKRDAEKEKEDREETMVMGGEELLLDAMENPVDITEAYKELKSKTILLSDKDRDILLNTIENPPGPNKALKELLGGKIKTSVSLNKFWLVIDVNNHVMSKHNNEDEAIKEAHRLAKSFMGKKFSVFEFKGYSIVPEVEATFYSTK